jgi:uncharacterized protein
MNYFDSSAVIKRFVEEAGSKRVEALFEAEAAPATSKVAYAEVHAGLARKLRERGLTPAAHRNASRAFDADWPAYVRVELVDPLLVLARNLIQRRPLRGFEAIHLASALRLRDQIGEEVLFVAADERLLAVASSEGLATVDVRR